MHYTNLDLKQNLLLIVMMIKNYIIIPWSDFEINTNQNICNFINNNSEIIDVISMDRFPINSIFNPKALVIIIYFENNSLVIHDIISLKTWLEKVGIFREPLSNMILPFNMLSHIKLSLKNSFFRKMYEEKPRKYGIKFNDEEQFILIVYKFFNKKYSYYSLDSDICNLITNPYFRSDLIKIRSGEIIQTYDLINDNVKINYSGNKISFHIMSDYINYESYIQFNKKLRYEVKYINISSDEKINKEDIGKFLDYIKSLSNKVVNIDTTHLR